MAAPNMVNVTSIYGKSVSVSPTTSATSVISNAASSGKVLKINTLIVSNIDGTDPYSVIVNLYPDANLGGTATAIAYSVVVPANSSLVVIDKGWPVYLEENKSIGAIASLSSKLQIVCSYEEIT